MPSTSHSATFQLVPWQPKPKKIPRPPRETAQEREFNKHCRRYEHLVQPADPDETWFRHTCWKAKRQLVRETLIRVGTNPNAVDRFDQCGGDCMVEWSEEEQRYRLRANYCKCRHCEPCMRAKSNLLAANLRTKLETDKASKYRFVTLTLKHTDAPLVDQIRRLYASFKKLRAAKAWSKTQRGGAAILEVKWQSATRRWHPHLHVVSAGEYLPQQTLSDAWYKATGDSHVVDIRALNSARDAAHYVSKYVSKGTTNDVWRDASAAQEWVTATKGVRTCATFGTWRGYALLHVDVKKGDWKPYRLLRSICSEARAGGVAAIHLLLHLEDVMQYNPHRSRQKKEPDKP